MPHTLEFGPVQIRPSERVVLVHGQPVTLGARAFDVLLALAERHERVVSKNELLDLAWPGMVVEENNLSVQISALRKSLGAQVIATVTGRGYRMALPPRPRAEPSPTPPQPRAAASESRLPRRLAAIVHASVVGWSRLLSRDAMAAVQCWKQVRRDLVEPSAQRFGGRIIELTPERMLLEFASAVDAIAWGDETHDVLAAQREQQPGFALRCRIGIAVDDMIVDEGKLIGAGVADALEAHESALHDEIIVTDTVRMLAQGRLAIDFQAMSATGRVGGPPSGMLWRLAVPARTPGAPVPAASPSAAPIAPPWSFLPSLAVLPLQDLGAQPDALFADALTEEIIAMLALNRAWAVIAYGSTLRYRPSGAAGAIDPVVVAGELGVGYVLAGTLNRNGRKLSVDVHLTRAGQAQPIWRGSVQDQDHDVFRLQQALAMKVAGAIDPQVRAAELILSRERPTANASAYDQVLQGVALLHSLGPQAFERAGELLRQAVALDPHYAQAHAHLAWWHNLRIGECRSDEVEADKRAALALALRAAELDPRDAVVLSVAGHLLSFLARRFDEALALFDRALAINPSCAVAWSRSATTLAYLGRGEEAITRVRHALRLSPFDPHVYATYTTLGTACLVAGRPSEAAAWLARARRSNPLYMAAWRLHVAALELADEPVEARSLAEELIEHDPGFRVGEFGSWYPLTEPHRSRLLAALCRAGLPA